MNIYTPYTYLIGWSWLNIWYYGVRYAKDCHPDDLWVTYFTSSKQVKKYRKIHGEPDIVKVRKTFIEQKIARLWEHKVLRRLKVSEKEYFLNQTDSLSFPHYRGKNHPMFGKDRSGSKNPRFGAILSEETRKLISINHQDVSGSNNPNAKTYILTNPEGKQEICHGTIAIKCKEYQISKCVLFKNIGNIVSEISKMTNKSATKSFNTIGWKLEIVNNK